MPLFPTTGFIELEARMRNKFLLLLAAGVPMLLTMPRVMAEERTGTNKQAASAVPKTGAAVVTANPKTKRTWAAGSESGEGKTRTPRSTSQR